MAQVPCNIATIDLVGSSGRSIPSTRVTCNKCGYATESYGTGERSIRRCLALLREECPEDEENYYLDEDAMP